MKKIVFALQIFGILAMFPLYVALEMNHGTGSFPENKNHPVVKEKIGKNIIRVSLNAEAQIESAIPVTMITASRPPVSKNEAVKVLSKAGYKTFNN